MNFQLILLIAIVLIIIGLLIYYFAYYRNSKPTSAMNFAQYVSLGKGNDTNAMVPMLTNEQVHDFLGENFTLSYYIQVTNLESNVAVPDNEGNAFVPIVWIVGVGALAIDMIKGTVNMVFTSAFYDPANPVQSVQTVPLNINTNSEINSGLFVNKWIQITLTMNGTNACVYLNSPSMPQTQTCITLQNVTLAAPTGIYLLQGQGPAVKVASIQAWPFTLSSSAISMNYKSTSANDGTPSNLPTTSLSDILNTARTIMCNMTGLCPSPRDNDVTLGPFSQINYEYA